MIYKKSDLSEQKKKKIYERLCVLCGKEHVSDNDVDKIAYSHDFWPITLRWLLDGKQAASPDFIVWPETAEHISGVVRVANEASVPIVPFGEGSGVMGGAIPVLGGIVIDMKRMADIIKIDEKNLMVTVQTGINGMNLERALNHAGFTLAHVPQSFYCSTVGGWLACRAAGQFSTKYGKIDDMMISLEAVLPDGSILRSKTVPKSSTGPRVDTLLLGAEGTLGIITEVTLKIWPLPQKKALRSYAFTDLNEALEAVRGTVQKGIFPAVIRIYDREETKRHFYDFGKAKGKLMLVMLMQGDGDLVALEEKVSDDLCTAHGGVPCGEAPVQHWLDTRFNVKESSQFSPRDIVFDTIEVSVTWDKAPHLYESMITAMKKVSGVLVASAHASHFYQQGVCFYFTFGGTPPKKTAPNDFYNAVWEAAMRSCLDSGGSISHHHGVGLMRSKWLAEELGEGYEALRKIKRALDPNNIMNPGKMGL